MEDQLDLLMIIFLSSMIIIILLAIIIYRIFFAKDRLKDIEENHSKEIEKINNNFIRIFEETKIEEIKKFEHQMKIFNTDADAKFKEYADGVNYLLESQNIIIKNQSKMENLIKDKDKIIVQMEATLSRKHEQIKRLKNGS